MYNSVVLICSEITSQKKIHLTIFFYLSIKKALEDFLHDNRDSSHKHTEAMRLYAPSLKLLYRFSSPQGDISVLACIYSVPQLPICHLTQKYLSTNIKVAPLTYNIPVSVWKGVLVKECFYLLVQKAAQWLDTSSLLQIGSIYLNSSRCTSNLICKIDELPSVLLPQQ